MPKSNNIILLEFNELCPDLLQKFIQAGHLPNFKKLYENADTYITDANCEESYLEPWVQWVTLHTGVDCKEHGVFRLGEADNLKHENIWDELSKKGQKSWLCGSMNATWPKGDKNITALPDPWSLNATPSHDKLKPFYDFVRANVQEHTNKSSKNSLGSLFSFGTFMLLNGLRFKTVAKVAALAFDVIKNRGNGWKKAVVLDWLQYDVYRHIYKKERPAFSTFFSNSTAHFQHKYWRYMEPSKFQKKPTQREVELYGDAILFAYKNHDTILGETLALADENTQVVMASALSQQPFSDLDAIGGKIFYRPHDINKIADTFGLEKVKTVNPVMSHQFQIIFEDNASALAAEQVLARVKLDGESEVFKTNVEDDTLFCGCTFHQVIDDTLLMTVDDKQVAFREVFYLADSLKSGKHHPQGVLWVQKNQHSVSDKTIPLTSARSVILSEMATE